MVYAVIDTNVFVAALLTRNNDSATVKVYEAIADGKINAVLELIVKYGVEVFPKPTGEILIDMDDLIFYEVAMEKQDDNSYLVTGNMKHYPIRDFIVTPYEMMCILDETEKNTNNAL